MTGRYRQAEAVWPVDRLREEGRKVGMHSQDPGREAGC